MDNVRALEAIVVWQRAIDAFGQQQPTDRHRELLARYQVRTDGTTMWPSGPPGWVAEQLGVKKQEVTLAEAAMLDDLGLQKGLAGLKRFLDIRQDALHRSEIVFGGKGNPDGQADAFRHAYWNALMTQQYGEAWAAEYATSHERNPTSNHIAVAMDLHNNEVGREIARANPNVTADQFAGLVEQAVRDGRMVVIDPNDTLVPSGADVVTRDTTNNPWSKDNPDRADDRDPGPRTATLKPSPMTRGG